MTSKILALACFALPCMAVASPPAPAAPPTPPASAASPAPPLADLLREAEENNPELGAAAAGAEAASHVPGRAATAPDPEIGLTYLNDGISQFTLGDSEFTYVGLTWSQEHPYPGKLKRAEAVAEAEVGVAAA